MGCTQSSVKENNVSSTGPPIHPRRASTIAKYQILKTLGEGASCRVMAVEDKGTKRRYAMKVMDKSAEYNRSLFENEARILNALKHPNVLELVDAYEDDRTYNLITVLCQGGELFDRVKEGKFSEKDASRLTRQMLKALSFCHKQNIVHRDLKPENFVFESSDEASNMKLIDFGCAKVAKDNDIIDDVAGSPYYCAPEVLNDRAVRNGRIWKAADMWSVGVIIFLLVCGYPPFNGESQDEIFYKIRKGKYKFPKKESGINLSTSVKELIALLLQMDPLQRASADIALNHPWVIGQTATDTPLPRAMVEALNNFRSKCKLKKAVARALCNRMTESDKENLMRVFRQFDQNGDGQLGPEEIAKLMKHIGKSDAEAAALMSEMDEDGSGTVSIEEFAAGITAGRIGSSEQQIKASFDMFDVDGDGFVTHKEIEKMCSFLTPDATRQLIKEVDENGDGKITFQEWLKAMADFKVSSR